MLGAGVYMPINDVSIRHPKKVVSNKLTLAIDSALQWVDNSNTKFLCVLYDKTG